MPPTRIGEWYVIVRLEKFIPAQMDESMRRRLLTECFNNWLKEQLDQVNLLPADATAQAPLEVPPAAPTAPPIAS